VTERHRRPARPCGDDLVSIDVDDAGVARHLAAALRADATWLEVVAGTTSVVVQFDPATLGIDAACERAQQTAPATEPVDIGARRILTVPVRYDGPDIDAVCRELDLSRDDFIALHTGAAGCVEMLGFTPGFAYVAGLDPRLAVGRLPAPRQRVPAGAVGIAGTYTGLYSLPGPGGWSLVGHTTLRLFDPAGDRPFALEPGQVLHFVADPDT
jgi:allophanate hydrolase